MNDHPEILLREWMCEHLDGIHPGSPLALKQFQGGQSNPTFLITQDAKQFVLRRKPTGVLLPSAHAIDREYKVISELAKQEFPIAKPLGYCQDTQVIGSEFYVMEYIQGRIFWDPRLPEVSAPERQTIYDEMNSVISRLHQFDPVAIGLEDYGRFGGFVKRQIERWTKQYKASETEHIEAMNLLMEWLPEHIPSSDMTRLVHGDFRLDNMIFHPTKPEVMAVLDWELSTLGNPLSDFAYHMMVWRFAPELFRGLAGTDFGSLHIPNEPGYLAAYLKRTGFELESDDDWEFYIIFNIFRMAAILQGVYSRALQGNAASDQGIESGKTVRPMAELAWQQVEKLRL